MKHNLVALTTIVRKELRRFFRIWMQSILPPVITLSLYFTIFGNLIGSQIERIHGYRYMEFIAPGLIMMFIISNSYGNVVSSFYSARFMRSIEELLVSPASNVTILLGYTLGGLARGMVVGLVVTMVSMLFTHLQVSHALVTFLIVILSSFLFSLAGFANAIFAESFDDISIIPTFVLTPLTYLGGVFYSIEMLPGIWRSLSYANPILYMINAFRYGILGVSDVSIYLSFSIVCGAIVFLFLFNLFLLNRGVGIRT